MKIIVCVKRVPDTAARIRVGQDGKSIDTQGVDYIISPYDEIALEASLRVKDWAEGREAPTQFDSSAGEVAESVRLGQIRFASDLQRDPVEVTVVSMGPAECLATIRNCLAMGADRAMYVKDEEKLRDFHSTATALAGAIRGSEFDLVLFGQKAADDDGGQIGALVAHQLGVPFVSLVVSLELGPKKLLLRREVEGGQEVLEVPRPMAFSAQKGLCVARYPSLKGIMGAKKKPVEERVAASTAPGLTVLSMEPPPPRPSGKIVGKGKEAVPDLVRLLREEAKVI